MTLQRALETAVRAMWPARSAQELLLDLGERKQWTPSALETAAQGAAEWLSSEFGLAPDVRPIEGGPPSLDALKAHATAASEGSGPAARWAEFLAPAVGTTSKTLANSLSDGLRSDRTDHRWLASIARALSGEASHVDELLFHRRTPSGVSRQLGLAVGSGCYGAEDAVLVVSLLAAWQRRRPTHQARAARGQSLSRRAVPKPVAALQKPLIEPGQIPALVTLAEGLPRGGRELILLVLEAALTEAHLAPHAPRVVAEPTSRGTGEGWLRPALVAVEAVDDLSDRAALRFRLERMRAWRDARPFLEDGGVAQTLPYVRATLELEQRRRTNTRLQMRWSLSSPGLMMLVPLLRTAGYEVVE